jgi:hypothetical protein
MFTAVIAFLLGVFFAPVIRPLFRPLLIEVIKAGLMVGDEAKRLSAEVREGIDDAKAEAEAAAAEKARAAAKPATAPPPPPPAAETPSQDTASA